jgi:transcription initiation factor TFIID subunit TAF12
LTPRSFTASAFSSQIQPVIHCSYCNDDRHLISLLKVDKGYGALCQQHPTQRQQIDSTRQKGQQNSRLLSDLTVVEKIVIVFNPKGMKVPDLPTQGVHHDN